MIIQQLISAALEKAGGRRIRDARVGIEYACVLLEDGSCGLAYTFRDERDCGAVLDSAPGLAGQRAEELICWAADANRYKAALGLAAINAVLNSDGKCEREEGNIIDALSPAESEVFGIVGEFQPVLRKIAPMTKNVHVFELNPARDSGFLAPDDMPLYLPKCDYVLITASAIINHTIDGVLALCGGESVRKVYLMGPSAPLCPEVLGKHNVTVIAGCEAVKPELLMEIISLCGGTKHMKPAVKQVIVKTKSLEE